MPTKRLTYAPSRRDVQLTADRYPSITQIPTVVTHHQYTGCIMLIAGLSFKPGIKRSCSQQYMSLAYRRLDVSRADWSSIWASTLSGLLHQKNFFIFWINGVE